MTGAVWIALVGVGIGGALGAVLTTFVAYSKGFKQGFSDGEAKSLRGVANSGRVHGSTDTAANGTMASGKGNAASLRSEQVQNDD